VKKLSNNGLQFWRKSWKACRKLLLQCLSLLFNILKSMPSISCIINTIVPCSNYSIYYSRCWWALIMADNA
jgi:hypothetical protein